MKKTGFVIILLFLVQFAHSQKAIFIEKTGEGKPIIFLPGFTSPGSVWDETIQNLEGSFETLVVSYAGFNGLAAIDTPWYETIKKQLIDYIKNRKLSEITIIGHSMGGNLAIDVAFELKDQLTGLILVESIPCMRELMMPGVPASGITYNNPYNNQMLEMSDDDFKQMAARMSQNMTNVQSKVEVLTKWSINADRKTYVYGYTDLLKLDLRDRLSKITVETLILGASFPNLEAVKSNYEKQFMNLNNKEILLAEKSKHFIMFDQPDWMYTQMNKYLKLHVK